MNIVCADPRVRGAALAIYREDAPEGQQWAEYEVDLNVEDIIGVLVDLDSLFSVLVSDGQTVFMCEQQFLRIHGGARASGAKARDVIKLSYVRGVLETVARFSGCIINKAMLASDWQPKILKRLGKPPERDKESMAIATAITGKKPSKHDFADAVCMAEVIRRRTMPDA